MTDDNPKQKLMIARQQLDKLSLFIVNLAKFFEGVNPKVDADLLAIRKLLSGKPEYEKASELSIKINDDLKNQSKYQKQQQLSTLSQIENSLRKLNEIEAIDKDVKAEIKVFLQSFSSSNGNETPMSVFEQALTLFKKALMNNTVSKTAFAEQNQQKLHNKITQELKELTAPYLKKNPHDKIVVELQRKLVEGLEPDELLKCCLSLLRFVMKDVVKEAGAANKLVHEIYQSLQKVNQGIKTTIDRSRDRLVKRETQNKTMQTQIDAMESALSDSHDVQEIKHQTQFYLSKLQSSLKDTAAKDRKEQEKLIALLVSMQKRLDFLESKAGEYRNKLLDQRKEALTDSLTKLPNRLASEEKAQSLKAESATLGRSVCMALLDIDDFKSINDKYGHSVGDKTLQVMAGQFKANLSDKDFVGRWGGEEFLVLMPNTTLEDAIPRIENLRQKIAKLPFMFKGKRVSVTISIGLVTFQADETFNDAFEKADKLLYEAKHAGRNQTQHEDIE